MSTPRSYHHAPRLPEGESLRPRDLLGGSDDPFELEIGPGRGRFIIERLEVEPRARIVGLEIRRKWAAIVDERIAERGLASRARVFAEDAAHALCRLAPATVSRVFVLFPDPWWKKRHAKRRVVTASFVNEVVRVLVPGGELFIETDVAERADEYERVVEAVADLRPVGPLARRGDNPFSAKSTREHRADADGLPVHRLLYRRSCP